MASTPILPSDIVAGDLVTYRHFLAPSEPVLTELVYETESGDLVTPGGLAIRTMTRKGPLFLGSAELLTVDSNPAPAPAAAEGPLLELCDLRSRKALIAGAQLTYRRDDAPVGSGVTAVVLPSFGHRVLLSTGLGMLSADGQCSDPFEDGAFVITGYSPAPQIVLDPAFVDNDVLRGPSGDVEFIRRDEHHWAELRQYGRISDHEASYLLAHRGYELLQQRPVSVKFVTR